MFEQIDKVVEKILVFDSKWLELVELYVLLCLAFSVATGVIRVIIRMFSFSVRWVLIRVGEYILERDKEQRLIFSRKRLFAIKLMADVEFYNEWINNYVFETYRIVTTNEKSYFDKCMKYSLEKIVGVSKRIFHYFFHFSLSRIVFFVLGVYYIYKERAIELLKVGIGMIPWSEIDIDAVLDFGELVSLLCILLYILLDMRHKSKGYTELRQARFQELVRMEEKLLFALEEMRYCLYKNMSLLCETKHLILGKAASVLTGKECNASKGKLEFGKKPYRECDSYPAVFEQFDDLKNVFLCIEELDAEYKKSLLRHSNILMTDYEAMLKSVRDFWEPEAEEVFSKWKNRGLSLSKSFMERWFQNNVFEKTGREEEKFCWSEDRTQKHIQEMSDVLDYCLERAFKFDMYLVKHGERIQKHLMKVHNYSRFRLF